MKHWKRILSIPLALAMATGMFCTVPVTANAADAVTYTEYSWDAQTKTLSHTDKTITDYKIVTGEMFKTYKDGLKSGTYVVIGNVTVNDYFYIRKNQTVNLIVQPGVTLTCEKGIGCGYDKKINIRP